MRLFILACDGSDRRLVTYRKTDQVSTCIDDSRTQNSHCQKRELHTWKERKPCGTGMELELLV